MMNLVNISKNFQDAQTVMCLLEHLVFFGGGIPTGILVMSTSNGDSAQLDRSTHSQNQALYSLMLEIMTLKML